MSRDEFTFRLLLTLGLMIVIPILRYHRIRARTASRVVDRRAEGLWMYFGLRGAAYAAFFALIAYVINPDWMAWSALPLPAWVRWLGVAGAIAAAAGMVAVLTSLGTNLTDTVIVREHHTLVTRGPYRWVRHPFYAAFALGLASNTLVTSNWFLGLAGLLAVALVVVRTSDEERKLIERFGDQYRCYMERTGRFFPRLRIAAHEASRPVQPAPASLIPTRSH
jgi:protein-S-isoprenylcysteine O-methyltransferase Ste14